MNKGKQMAKEISLKSKRISIEFNDSLNIYSSSYQIVITLYAIKLRRLFRPYLSGYRKVKYRSRDMTLNMKRKMLVRIFFIERFYHLICHIDDVLQQTSNVDHTLHANALNGKCPINSTTTASGITKHATRQSVNASDVKK